MSENLRNMPEYKRVLGDIKQEILYQISETGKLMKSGLTYEESGFSVSLSRCMGMVAVYDILTGKRHKISFSEGLVEVKDGEKDDQTLPEGPAVEYDAFGRAYRQLK